MALRVDFLGTRIDAFTPVEVVDELAARVQAGQRTRVFFVNAHCINVARSDGRYRECLRRAEMVLPDGSGVLLGSRLLGVPLRDNLNGTDLVPRLLGRLEREGWSVFVFGGKPGVADEASRRLKAAMPGLVILGHSHGYLDQAAEDALMERLRGLRPDVLLVGKGVPLQELWLDTNWDRLNACLGIAVGGLIDFMAGVHPRAPLWMRQLGIEWLFRMSQEPRRLGRRYLLGNVVFMAGVARGRLGRLTHP